MCPGKRTNDVCLKCHKNVNSDSCQHERNSPRIVRFEMITCTPETAERYAMQQLQLFMPWRKMEDLLVNCVFCKITCFQTVNGVLFEHYYYAFLSALKEDAVFAAAFEKYGYAKKDQQTKLPVFENASFKPTNFDVMRQSGKQQQEWIIDGDCGPDPIDNSATGTGPVQAPEDLRKLMEGNAEQLQLFDRVHAYWRDDYSPFFIAKFVNNQLDAPMAKPLRLFVSGVSLI